MWSKQKGEAGVHDLLGYAKDYALGQQRGLQTLVLKTLRFGGWTSDGAGGHRF